MVLSDWNYYKVHEITSTSTTTDYQVKFVVYFGSGTDSANSVYLNSKCNADFSDVRFTNSAGTVLPYYIESYTSGVSATIWVKVDSILTSTSIMLYYGNPSATSLSNATDTFIFFDNFPGSAIDTTKWTIVSGSATVSDNTLHVSAAFGFNTKAVWDGTSSIATEYQIKFLTTNTMRCRIGGAWANIADRGVFDSPLHIFWGIFRDAYLSANVWYTNIEAVDPPSALAYWNIGAFSFNASIHTGTTYPLMRVSNGDGNSYLGTFDIKSVKTRKYLVTSPVHVSWSSEVSNKYPLLPGWKYYKVHTITSAATLTNYQVKLTINYGSGTDSTNSVYLNSRCNADFSDVRILDSSGNVLPYWIESYTSGTSAIFWIKIASLSTTCTLYIYYGNTSAISLSNPDNTFIYFDDCSTDKRSNYPPNMTFKAIPIYSASISYIIEYDTTWY